MKHSPRLFVFSPQGFLSSRLASALSQWTTLSLAVVFLVNAASAGSLKFNAEVPQAPAELPLLRLKAQPAPLDLMNRFLAASNTGQTTKMTKLSEAPFIRETKVKVPDELIGVVEGEHVKAWANIKTGDAQIYPSLSNLKPLSPTEARRLAERTREIFESPQFLGKDETRFVVDEPQLLQGATLARDANGQTRVDKPVAPYASYILARRFVGEYRVDGPGSRALVVVGHGGAIEGLTRMWKTGAKEGTVRAAFNADQIKSAITRQLEPAQKNSDVVVDAIELAYYDANENFLQPVYRFTAQIHHTGTTDKTTDDDFVIGYIPFGKKAAEPIPVLGKAEGPAPKVASDAPPKPKDVAEPKPNDPLVGRYVVRNDDAGWVNDANAFWSSLSSSWTSSLFTNSQYYWAEPRLFTNQKNSFINAMNLALIEVHGDWWLYSTLRNCCDLVNINGDIPSPGYGPSASGRLADWVIHSCEVVPAPDDTSHWPDPWWTIFGGVRNVVGYRTIMYISDGAGGPYGHSLANLAPVVSSWLSDVISLNAYSGHPKTPAHGGINRPMGRPSSISMCGHDGDSVLSTSSLGRASCLTVWWFPD